MSSIMSTLRAAALVASSALIAGLLAAPTLQAAELTTSRGERMFVRQAPSLTLPFGGASSAAHVVGGGLRYEVVSASGTVRSGLVHGTTALPGHLAATLAESPITGEVFLVFAAPDAAQSRLQFAVWLGQDWSDPLPLTAPAGRPDKPVLAFRPTGDALLAWQHEAAGAMPTVLVRHFELAARGEVISYALLQLVDASAQMIPIAADVRLGPGVAHVACDPRSDGAFVVVADPHADAVGVLRVGTTRAGGGAGFNAPPVPVNFGAVMAPEGVSGGGPIGGRSESGAGEGVAYLPFRIELMGTEAYYWFDEFAVHGMAFRDGQPVTALLTLSRPATEAQAHLDVFWALRAALGRETGQDRDLSRLGGKGTARLQPRR